ncbi:MAG TPA: hypothetical protein VK830_03155, partial [Xanthomonadales bacterium]|nr:hypothetical protein [Xanthomonadales bacterium]
SIANVQAGFTNTADVEAFDTETEQQVTDSDTSEVTTANPGIQITKTPATQQVSPGGTAAFTLTLINTGDEDLDTVVVNDPLCDAAPVRQSGDTDADEELDLAETWVYTCSTTNVQAEFTNTADVSAIPVPFDQPAVTDSDTAEVTLAIPTPAVGIVKSPVNQFVALGGTANFTLTVTNEGDVRLEDVLVTDPLCDASPQFQTGDDGADGVLGLDETWIYTCSTANVQASFTNTGNVSATPEFGGDDVTDSDTANVTVGTAPDVPIPTLGQWLLVFLAALLLGSGLLARRRVLGRK